MPYFPKSLNEIVPEDKIQYLRITLVGTQLYTKNLSLRNMEELMNHRSNLVHKIYNHIIHEVVHPLETTEDAGKYAEEINDSQPPL